MANMELLHLAQTQILSCACSLEALELLNILIVPFESKALSLVF